VSGRRLSHTLASLHATRYSSGRSVVVARRYLAISPDRSIGEQVATASIDERMLLCIGSSLSLSLSLSLSVSVLVDNKATLPPPPLRQLRRRRDLSQPPQSRGDIGLLFAIEIDRSIASRCLLRASFPPASRWLHCSAWHHHYYYPPRSLPHTSGGEAQEHQNDGELHRAGGARVQQRETRETRERNTQPPERPVPCPA